MADSENQQVTQKNTKRVILSTDMVIGGLSGGLTGNLARRVGGRVVGLAVASITGAVVGVAMNKYRSRS